MTADRSRYLFVVGCPRSGTTATWRLLVSHPQIAIGTERYGSRFESPAFLDHSLFERERFFDLQAGDTFYTELGSAYDPIRDQYGSATYHGDKIPYLFRHLGRLESVFGNELRVVFVVRDIWPVAASYQRRHEDATDETWPPGSDYRTAISDWSQALREIEVRGHDERYHVVAYESLFEKRVGLDDLFAFLDLPVPDVVRATYYEIVATGQKLREDRVPVLTPPMIELIARHARFDTYRQVLRLADRQADAMTLS